MLPLPARALVCGVAAAVLAGCTSARGAQTSPEPPPPRITLADLKSAQDAQAQELARLAGDVKALDAQQAFLVAELKNLGDQVNKLRSSVDEAESAVRSLRATPVPPESRPAIVTPSPPVAVPAPVAAPKNPDAAAAAPTVAAPPASPSRNLEADRTFAAALARLRAGDDGQAALEFAEFVAQFPGHPQAAAAQNHIGDAYFRQREFRRAMEEFQKTVDGYTQAAQVSEALLKIGLCHRALGDTASARASWEQVIKQFPKSDAARQARSLVSTRATPAR